MFVRNRLKAGDSIVVIPVGLPLTVQYNEDGNVQKCFSGFETSDTVEGIDVPFRALTQKFTSTLVDNRVIPTQISMKNGITRVSGILYFNYNLLSDISCNIPSDITNNIVTKFIDNPSVFTFYATSMKSTAIPIKGLHNQRNWLMLSKFKTLPNLIVPSNLVADSHFYELLNRAQYKFSNYNVMAIAIFSNDKVEYIGNKLSQQVVKYTDSCIDYDGTIYGTIECQSGKKLRLDYSKIVTYNIKSGTMLLFDSDYQIIHSYDTKSVKEPNLKVASTLVCKYCGRQFSVPSNGRVQCPDDDCPSKLPQRLNQFLTCLNMPSISLDLLQEYVYDKQITCITDIFTLDMYKDFEIHTDLTHLLRALIPYEVLHTDTAIKQFINGCQNNSITFEHYLYKPDRIVTDLDIPKSFELVKLIDWLSKPYNVSDVTTLLEMQNIVISKTIKQFDGASLFRNKTIYITGKFLHGTHSDIRAIIQSYDAKVVDAIQLSEISDIHCVVVGGLNEYTNGEIVNLAKENNITVFTESDFFRKYGIDDDLSNLV